ncbi:MAG: ATP-binding protein [Mycoplasmatales bacterium]
MNFGEKPLSELFEEVYQKLEAENEIITTFKGAKRIDNFKYELEVVREALINAFVHNDYSNYQYPQIHNKIEIISSGGLPQGQTKSGFKLGISKPQNKEIVDIFRDFGITESLGIGIPKIVAKYKEDILTIIDDVLIVEIPFVNSKSNIKENENDINKITIKEFVNSKSNIKENENDINKITIKEKVILEYLN